jgi:hypothetical protein
LDGDVGGGEEMTGIYGAELEKLMEGAIIVGVSVWEYSDELMGLDVRLNDGRWMRLEPRRSYDMEYIDYEIVEEKET